MSPIHALVVDDSQAMRKSLMYALQRMGNVVCVEAQDGAEALRKFAEGAFDIVLTDINMPLLDGLKLIGHIRQDKKKSAVPIIVITTESAETDRARAMKLGASAYLVKPVQAPLVLETVKQLLEVD
ncbi:MAG: response regulator [Myxococcota bacterium]